MANSIKSFNEALASANSTLEAKGQVIADFDKFIVNGEKKTFKQLAVKDGFWFSLGELMENLLQDSGGNRIDSAKLKDAKIHNVNKRRRQEAHKFFKNFEKIVELKLINKHGSLGRLLTEFDSIVNPKVKTPVEPKVETPVEPQDEVKQIEDKSSVQSVKTADDLALDVLLQVEMNGISIADFKIAIANAIGMIEENNEVVPFDVAV
jgi:hypothetical protein